NVAGSTPEIWEVFQRAATNVNTTIVGISVYDLNEYRISQGLGYIVPLPQTIQDLRESGATYQFSRRVLSEYPLAYLLLLFPTAGNSDAFLVGVRRTVRERLGLLAATEDRARVLALPREPLMDFGKDEEKFTNMPRDRVLRRLSVLRSENRG